MTHAEALEYYLKAQKLAQRDYREKTAAGQSPFLPVLDDILQNVQVENQLPLGLIEMPLDLLVGTKTAGRTAAFASNFMPLLGSRTEFAAKWTNLCAAHLDEGIREPLKCFEYMGSFYVQEGNKRASVLKFFGASSVPANVTRVVPSYNDSPEVRLYYEFMHYYPLINTYALTDEQALAVKDLFPTWDDCVKKGKELPADFKLTDGGKLYKVLQAHTPQSDWKPSGTPSLYGLVSVTPAEEHAGTQEDPIPYVQMMLLEQGKYYTQDGILYLCIQSTKTGYPNDLKDMASLVQPVDN